MDQAREVWKRKLVLIASLLLNLGLLVYFKYSNFFIENLNAVLGAFGVQGIHWIKLILPIGISFYTFETITYVVDVYRKVHKPLNNFWDYQLYIILFPKLIAGPIVRYHDLAGQIEDRSIEETPDNRLQGLYRFGLGRGIPVLDFHRYFLEQKSKSKYPLYPQFGIHWSEYGMALAGDSLIRSIEAHCGCRLPRVFWKEVVWKKPEGNDVDIAQGMNLFWDMPSFKMAYPKLEFESEKGKRRPGVLVVSDSFYWGLFNFGISRSFDPGHFWFYNHEVYPEHFERPTTVKQLNLVEELNRHDVVVIMATEATLPRLGWGFIEAAAQALEQEDEGGAPGGVEE